MSSINSTRSCPNCKKLMPSIALSCRERGHESIKPSDPKLAAKGNESDMKKPLLYIGAVLVGGDYYRDGQLRYRGHVSERSDCMHKICDC
jgi:hypothetical protein